MRYPKTFEQSFASHPKSEFWSRKNTISPKDVFRCSDKKFWFNCPKCPHEFRMSTKHITRDSRWCPFCANRKLCENNEDSHCNICFEKSFAGYEKAKFWSKLNKKKPWQILKKCSKKFWFDCPKCEHSFDSTLNSIVSLDHWCPYCATNNTKLCGKEDCNFCFEKSFASHEKAKFWSKQNEKESWQVLKYSHDKIWFDCDKCDHEFEVRLNNVATDGVWCCYCGHRKLCDAYNCVFCFKASFASHYRSENWNYDKNKRDPRDMFKSGSQKCYFICDNNHNIYSTLYSISRGGWCKKCRNSKLEEKTRKFLEEYKIKYESQQTFEDLINQRCLPFDFYLPTLNALIEVDGQQHFDYIKHFHKTPEGFKKRVLTDIKKNYYAINKNYNFIRISYQEFHLLELYLSIFIRKIKKSYLKDNELSFTQIVMFSNPKLYKNTYLF